MAEKRSLLSDYEDGKVCTPPAECEWDNTVPDEWVDMDAKEKQEEDNRKFRKLVEWVVDEPVAERERVYDCTCTITRAHCACVLYTCQSCYMHCYSWDSSTTECDSCFEYSAQIDAVHIKTDRMRRALLALVEYLFEQESTVVKTVMADADLAAHFAYLASFHTPKTKIDTSQPVPIFDDLVEMPRGAGLKAFFEKLDSK